MVVGGIALALLVAFQVAGRGVPSRLLDLTVSALLFVVSIVFHYTFFDRFPDAGAATSVRRGGGFSRSALAPGLAIVDGILALILAALGAVMLARGVAG